MSFLTAWLCVSLCSMTPRFQCLPCPHAPAKFPVTHSQSPERLPCCLSDIHNWVTAFTCSDSLVFKQKKFYLGNNCILMWYLLQPSSICFPEAVRWSVWILAYNSVFEPLCPWRLQSVWLKGIILREHFNHIWTFSVARFFSYMVVPDLENALLWCKIWDFSPYSFNLQ